MRFRDNTRLVSRSVQIYSNEPAFLGPNQLQQHNLKFYLYADCVHGLMKSCVMSTLKLTIHFFQHWYEDAQRITSLSYQFQ